MCVCVVSYFIVTTLKLQERLTSTEFELHSVNHRLLQLTASSQHAFDVDNVGSQQVLTVACRICHGMLLTLSTLATPVKSTTRPRICNRNYLIYEVFDQTDILVGEDISLCD